MFREVTLDQVRAVVDTGNGYADTMAIGVTIFIVAMGLAMAFGGSNVGVGGTLMFIAIGGAVTCGVGNYGYEDRRDEINGQMRTTLIQMVEREAGGTLEFDKSLTPLRAGGTVDVHLKNPDEIRSCEFSINTQEVVALRCADNLLADN